MGKSSYERGRTDCTQDSFENCPFASVGGLEQRSAMIAPNWIAAEDAAEYLRGYRDAAVELYGDGWQKCKFEWVPTITIPAAKHTV